MRINLGNLNSLKHGQSNSYTYRSWQSMLNRVRGYDKLWKKTAKIAGPKIDPKWFDFINFYADMGERPKGCTIDRINNLKGYFKDNCRWASVKEQIRNRKCTLYMTVDGLTKPIGYFADLHNLSWTLVANRWRSGIVDPAILFAKSLKNRPRSKSGIQYVYKVNEKFKVQVKRKTYGTFKTLEEAVLVLEKVLDGLKTKE